MQNDQILLRKLRREKIAIKCNWRCYYCDRPFTTWVEFGLDHVLPKSKGGTGRQDNMVLACVPCNTLKAAMTVTEFIIFLDAGARAAQKTVDYYRRILKNFVYK